MSSPASLPKEITRSAELGELQKVVKWLRKGGLVDAHCSTTARDGRPTTITLLHAAAAHGHLALVRELLKRGASVDLPEQPRRHRAHGRCGLRPPLHRARPPAALGQPRPAGASTAAPP